MAIEHLVIIFQRVKVNPLSKSVPRFVVFIHQVFLKRLVNEEITLRSYQRYHILDGGGSSRKT